MIEICTLASRDRQCQNPECGKTTRRGQYYYSFLEIGENMLEGQFCFSCGSAIAGADESILDAPNLSILFERLEYAAREDKAFHRAESARRAE